MQGVTAEWKSFGIKKKKGRVGGRKKKGDSRRDKEKGERVGETKEKERVWEWNEWMFMDIIALSELWFLVHITAHVTHSHIHSQFILGKIMSNLNIGKTYVIDNGRSQAFQSVKAKCCQHEQMMYFIKYISHNCSFLVLECMATLLPDVCTCLTWI